ncbi:hypothetical protein B0A48_01119 [Cryoendolithus antarcticus]|uniref:Dihydroneopterin aldolase/epimerase domain-containing protein n=1 Tax=Cryoendolithus antarcticus TaxID=1507870 RepID=A0A1V8TSA1_9PEZI|nr:hypothetical protein B0A48_01119 [Cryoendolithus antarcticus]
MDKAIDQRSGTLSSDPDFALQPANNSIVAVQGLQLDSVLAPNIWGDIKAQPARVNVKVYLRNDFSSAAAADALDDSTLHYGNLAKRIRKACVPETAVPSILGVIIDNAVGLGTKGSIAEIVVELILPKACTYGEAVHLSESRVYSINDNASIVQQKFECRRMKLMVLVGVNAYERRGKQPLIVDLSIGGTTIYAAINELVNLERYLADIIEKTDFETLESLAEHAFVSLRGRLNDMKADVVGLRFEKPAAIAFADAAVVEIRRRV